MPTHAYRPERTAEDCTEQRRPRGREVADSLADRHSGYLPPSAQQCQIAEMQKWIDLCA
jgi:hypothetical protein